MSSYYKDSWKRNLGKNKKETSKKKVANGMTTLESLPYGISANTRSCLVNLVKYPLHGYVNYTKQGIEDPIVFTNHTGEYCLDSRIFYPNYNQYIQVAFIDPGLVSCGIRIVRYIVGTGEIINIWFGIHNFGVGIDQMIKGVEYGLENIKQTLIMCHHIVIESQYMKKEVNFRTFQHMISYIESFTRNQGMRAMIIEVSIALKTVFIGGPKNKKQNNDIDIKEWSKLKARYELIRRKDWVSLSVIECCLDKQDEDYCDTVCYDFAWWIYIRFIKEIFINVDWLYKLL